MKRLITENEERVYRAVSVDFDGLTPADAALKLGVSTARIHEVLQSVKRKAPQLFPLLTKQEAQAYELLREGKSDLDIEMSLRIDSSRLHKLVYNLRNKGRLERRGSMNCVRYEEHMANEITEKY